MKSKKKCAQNIPPQKVHFLTYRSPYIVCFHPLVPFVKIVIVPYALAHISHVTISKK